MSTFLTRGLAEVLREQEPEMCATIDRLVQAGQKPRTIQRVIDRQCPRGSVIPGLVNAYLRDLDTTFRASEEKREGRR